MSQGLFAFAGRVKHSDALENYIIKRAAEYLKNGLLPKVWFALQFPVLLLLMIVAITSV